jgi:hypothetical protein
MIVLMSLRAVPWRTSGKAPVRLDMPASLAASAHQRIGPLHKLAKPNTFDAIPDAF